MVPKIGQQVMMEMVAPFGRVCCGAVVAGVNSDNNVNLTVFNFDGSVGRATNVHFRNAPYGENDLEYIPYCWPIDYRAEVTEVAKPVKAAKKLK